MTAGAEPISERLTPMGLSLGLHIVILLGCAWLMALLTGRPSSPEAASPAATEVAIDLSALMAQVLETQPIPTASVARKEAAREAFVPAAGAPAEQEAPSTRLISSQNAKAASTAAPVAGGDESLPSQEGAELPGIGLQDARFRPGEVAPSRDTPDTPSPGPAAPATRPRGVDGSLRTRLRGGAPRGETAAAAARASSIGAYRSMARNQIMARLQTTTDSMRGLIGRGWVEVEYRLCADGTVQNFKVLERYLASTLFMDAVRTAVVDAALQPFPPDLIAQLADAGRAGLLVKARFTDSRGP